MIKTNKIRASREHSSTHIRHTHRTGCNVFVRICRAPGLSPRTRHRCSSRHFGRRCHDAMSFLKKSLSRAPVNSSRTAISIKRDNVMVVDGLSASDIGELPALSIGEALESLTGVASHRENGGATEVSIRGLGPFLSATTFNGREATNGSGDRSVNFSQFPSELMNKLVVYKTQDATLIEGGVAGVIALETLQAAELRQTPFSVRCQGQLQPRPAEHHEFAWPVAGAGVVP